MGRLNRFLKIFCQGGRQPLPPDFQNWLKINVRQRTFDGGVTLIEKAAADRVAVLAPHPDDDMLGCGGTLCKHRLAGDTVTVIYLTDGARGNDHAGPPDMALAQQRQREATVAAGTLGIDDLIFLDHPDGKLPVNQKTAFQILDILIQRKAGAIFLPFLLDEHPDHLAANKLFAILAKEIDRQATVYAYEIWTPLKPNRLVDITAVAHQKETAIREHHSQMKHIDYAGAILGLNRFRSLSSGYHDSFCEAFWVMNAHSYGRMVDRLTL